MSDFSPLVSVIIPCFNVEKHIHKAVDSIINQSYTNLEIILIEDGSSDTTLEICRNYVNLDKRIKLIENHYNIGLISTLNKAIQLAQGYYIARMDADDISARNRIEKQLEYFKKNPDISIVGTNSYHIDGSKKKTLNPNLLLVEPNSLKFTSYFSNPFIHGSILAKAVVLKENQYDKSYIHSEDFELWLRLNNLNYKFGNIDLPLYYYLVNEEGVSNKYTKEQIHSHNEASFYYLTKNLNYPISKSVVSILNFRPNSDSTFEDFRTSIQIHSKFININKKSKELIKYLSIHRFNIRVQFLKTLSRNSFAYYRCLIYSFFDLYFLKGIYYRFLKPY